MSLTLGATSATAATTRPPLTSRQQAAAVVLGLWTVVGLFLDGWAHDNNRPESFFTPWHGVLYSGAGAAAIFGVGLAVRTRQPGVPWLRTMPRGHGLTLAALAGFAAAALGDLMWHEQLGIEVGIEALLSPTHLVLMATGLAVLSAPLRTAWSAGTESSPGFGTFVPTVLSLALLVSVVGFFLVYLSPFSNDAAGSRFLRVAASPHDHPARDVGELQQLLGVASILMTTLLLAVPALLLLRRWRPPVGSFTVFVGVVILLFLAFDEFRQWPLLLAGVGAGAAADWAAHRLTPWTAVVVMTTVLWLSYFGLYQLTQGGVAWTAELWTGTVAVAALLSAGVGLLSARLPATGDVPPMDRRAET